MKSPTTKKEVQSLTGRVAALNRFISRSTDRCLPFFKALKKVGKSIDWTDECEKAFINLKEHMGKAPVLSKPRSGDVLLIYLSVSTAAISSVLVREEEKHEEAIYYVSKGFVDAEFRYPEIEKLAFALITLARKLRPYFQAHTIKVMTNQPLKQVLWKPETSGRLVKCAVELGEFDIHYSPRTAVKGQAIADFISKFTNPLFPSNGGNTENTIHPPRDRVQPLKEETGTPAVCDHDPIWTLYVDGSSNQSGSGAGLVLTTPQNDELEYALRFNFKASNNEAKYEALIAGLRIAKELEATKVRVHSDSQLVVNQVLGEYQAKDHVMAAYLIKVKSLLSCFTSYDVVQIPREQNERADALARLASAIDCNVGKHIPIEYMNKPSIEEEQETLQIDNIPNWMDPIFDFLSKGELPDDPLEARKVKYRAGRYLIVNGTLYKQGYSAPYLRCVTLSEGINVLSDIHEGICGNHSGARSLALKTLRQGYFWPTLKEDSKMMVQTCSPCQKNSIIPHQPGEPLTSMSASVPFSIWGIDFIGPMPKGTNKATHAVVCVDYNTKWAKAEPLTSITTL
ncbi:PREDICTED: uncharacterized protein LOC101291061 [Fragaria vesca subsp. vesca]|uniref:uncharacterized protein LOC101291061 n=1 Tax=Fragaria vesca subsp. vesca TaxID=101020 RepID=UPI0002C3276D|nr:PREDICTED: uncharacterized protein LOC101291061 [Fragaria vesca subsp. vesca]